MIVPIEDRWGILSVLEHEHGAEKALLSLNNDAVLKFDTIEANERECFLSQIASGYAVSAFRQGKEFFRQRGIEHLAR